MQTFLPYPDFRESARVLDVKRLGKQRVECVQIMNALTGQSKGWINHPATKMWRGYETALALYTNEMIREWVSRGYKNTLGLYKQSAKLELPPWLGDETFHASHKSNLMRKNRWHYGRFFGFDYPDDIPYVWPV